MSSFWSFWIIAIVVINVVGNAWLLMATRVFGGEADGKPMDHSYDGIVELNNPLPRWWFFLYWFTIIFAVVYLALYPGLGSFKGFLNWTSVSEHDQEVAAAEATYAPIYENYAKQPIEQLAKDVEAMKIAQRLFGNNCAVCHGSDARGSRGFPNLTDDDWLYGGTPENIEQTILNGRNAAMPAWGQMLGEKGVREVAAYVRSLSGASAYEQDRAAGEAKFKTTCIACHGPDGKGSQAMGAPNLTDNIWLYGGSQAVVEKTIHDGRKGQMPAHKEKLGEQKVHLLAAYVYSLSHK